ncbi:PIG-L deacetylase family protein [Candidatus Cyanaurora vandensis]|uniref:PIG-L deacetylase family protein n=1 Tax=Candidatus Cyanaurora vandensis TaxID=2714958 RepID=UPI002580CADC|nr:PIG-L deacetylase family protein [Candidatus Cyanaurora vandensis]
MFERVLAHAPVYPSASVATFGPTLVVAPHPDDESLGCGGALSLLKGMSVRVLIVSDGTASHPGSLRYPPAKLRALRETEAQAALAVLGVAAYQITFLGLKDGTLPHPGDPGFAQAVECCENALADFVPTTVLLPWRRDPHPDHRAVWTMMTSALGALGSTPRLLEYPVWMWDQATNDHLPRVGEVTAWKLDISSVLSRKLAAIAAHRSQTTDLIDDDPTGFRLTPATLAHFAQPWECYLESCDASFLAPELL